MRENIDDYLMGTKLIGDDFNEKEIEAWYLDEANAYASMVMNRDIPYDYEYHGMNISAGFKYLNNLRLSQCMGFGAASGLEFLPIKNSISNLTILDPGDFPENSHFCDIPIKYVKPDISGRIALQNSEFDIITCFGALHHVANVSFVISEFYRVLKPEGVLLIREPITNMGDWRNIRQGLTNRERGIPLEIMNKAMRSSGLKIKKFTYCDFSPLRVLLKKINYISPYNNTLISNLDIILSRLFGWNVHYNRVKFIKKIAPASGFWICTK